MRKEVRKFRRPPTGMYLVELLVALIFGALISFALLNILGQAMRQGTASQNQIYANSIAQELLESIRSEPFTTLSNNTPGTYNLLSNAELAGQAGPTNVRTAPVQLDFVSLAWTNQKTKTNDFKGSAVCDLQNGPVANSILVKISVSWQDSQNLVSKTVTTSTLVFEQGTNSEQ